MKFLTALARYFFPHDGGYLSILLLAISASALSCGIVAIALWIAHAPPSPTASDKVHRSCPEHSEKTCFESLGNNQAIRTRSALVVKEFALGRS
jgi:hypothetical protein